jgi:hypothetical protein
LKVPNWERATVAPRKITEYLLSADHERGRGKAGFFIRFGFQPHAWEALRRALLQHVAEHEVVAMAAKRGGMTYTVDGEIDTPSGRRPMIRTVWIIGDGDSVPHFVTAYPAKRRAT